MTAKRPFKCNQLSCTKTWKERADVLCVRFEGSTENSVNDLIDEGLVYARTVKDAKEQEKPGSIQLRILIAANLPTPAYASQKWDSGDIIGLIGEIVAEEYGTSNKVGERFYTKWRENRHEQVQRHRHYTKE